MTITNNTREQRPPAGAHRSIFGLGCVAITVFATLLSGCGWGSTVDPDITAPAVMSVNPPADELFVVVGEPISITFSEDVEGVDATSFTVADHLGNAVPGSVAGSPTVVFTPDGSLRHSWRYTVTITTAVHDPAGNALADAESWSFVTRPVPVHGGGWHSLAVDAAGNAWAWGAGWSGQLGDGTGILADNIDPLQVVGPGGTGTLTDVVAVAGGNEHSLALLRDGTVWGWGDNGSGQLGGDDGGTGWSDIPLQVMGPLGTGLLTDVIAISAEAYQSFALRSDGTVWGWGTNSDGQLGNGSSDGLPHPYPEQVVGLASVGYLTGVIDISAGYYHTLALLEDGTVWSWGDDGYGELGQNMVNFQSDTPLQVVGPGGTGFIDDVVDVEAGEWVSAVIRGDGSLWTFGDDTYGFLGDGGADASSAVPVQVVGSLSGVTSVAAGLDQMAARLADGTVWAWGGNDFAQLGDGSTINSGIPVQTLSEPDVALSGVVAIASTGYYSNYALMTDGTVLGWGWNDDGELGVTTSEVYSSRTCSSVPVQVGVLNLNP